jgi:hypothetical protein
VVVEQPGAGVAPDHLLLEVVLRGVDQQTEVNCLRVPKGMGIPAGVAVALSPGRTSSQRCSRSTQAHRLPLQRTLMTNCAGTRMRAGNPWLLALR